MQTINKIPVLDAYRRAKITIKPLDAKRGKGLDPGKCAIARACLRDMSAIAARVHVGRTYVELPAKLARKYGVKKAPARGPVWVRFRTPMALRTEIVSMDRHKHFDPGEYTLPPPQPSHRARGKRYGGASAKRTKRTKRTAAYRRPAPRHVLGGVRKFEPKDLRTAA